MVAQLTITMGVSALRRIPISSTLAGSEHSLFHNQYESLIRSGSLVGCNWLCLGAGRQVRELLPLLKAFGVGKVTIWLRETDGEKFAQKFAKCTELVNPQRIHATVSTNPANTAVLELEEFIIEGANVWRDAAAKADVISIHAGSLGSGAGRDISSPLPLDDAFFGLLKPSAIVINLDGRVGQ